MKNAITKSIILAVAIAAAVGGVLFFIKYIVSPPGDISAKAAAEEVFNSDLNEVVAAFNPDSLGLNDAEVAYDAILDRASLFKDDELIVDEKIYDKNIADASEKFAKTLIAWSYDKFNKPAWNTGDHSVMLRLIGKMRKTTVEEGSKKALSPETLASLTEIESVINDYNRAWAVARKTIFSNYQNVAAVRNEAKTYSRKRHLSNCTSLVNALNAIGEKQENSCYNQLRKKVERLHYLFYFENRNAYNAESKRIYGLIKEFEDTGVFGVSTASHAKVLKDLHDTYDMSS